MKELIATFSYQNIFWKSPISAEWRNGLAMGVRWWGTYIGPRAEDGSRRRSTSLDTITSSATVQYSTITARARYVRWAGPTQYSASIASRPARWQAARTDRWGGACAGDAGPRAEPSLADSKRITLVTCHWPASPHWLDVAIAVVLEVT